MLLDLDHLIETLIFDKNYTWYWLLFPAFLQSQHNTFYLYLKKTRTISIGLLFYVIYYIDCYLKYFLNRLLNSEDILNLKIKKR